MRVGPVLIAMVIAGPATALRAGEGPVQPGRNGSATTGQVLTIFPDDTSSGTMVAAQTLSAIITQTGVGPLVDAGEARRFATGSNAINDNGFATFAGILTQSWNTGVNANTQAATNIAWSGRISASNAALSLRSEGPR